MSSLYPGITQKTNYYIVLESLSFWIFASAPMAVSDKQTWVECKVSLTSVEWKLKGKHWNNVTQEGNSGSSPAMSFGSISSQGFLDT